MPPRQCALALLFLVCLPAQAQPNAPDLSSRLNTLINTQFAATKCPGLSVTIATNNEIVFSAALGMTDIEQRVSLKTTSVHRLASLSKPITGTILMDLMSQGKLALDTPIRRYLPELPATYADVTLRHLLDHQSGIGGDEGEAFAFNLIHYPTSRDAMKLFINAPLRFKPGSKTEYSSKDFTIAGAAAEAVTGRSFQQLSADFFARHGITGLYLDDPLAIVPGRVRGYLVDPNTTVEFNDGHTMTRDYLAGTPGPVTNARAYDISNRYPAGGFDASGESLLHFVITVATGKVLSPQVVQEMWTPQTTSDGTKGVFGIGWGVSQREEKTMVGMNGAEPSTTTFLRYFPDSGTGVALLCNAEGAHDLPKLLESILQEISR